MGSFFARKWLDDLSYISFSLCNHFPSQLALDYFFFIEPAAQKFTHLHTHTHTHRQSKHDVCMEEDVLISNKVSRKIFVFCIFTFCI